MSKARTADRARLVWKFDEPGFSLHWGQEPEILARLVPDTIYPQMWRIDHNGKLSDMVNLTRAKNAAATLAFANMLRFPLAFVWAGPGAPPMR